MNTMLFASVAFAATTLALPAFAQDHDHMNHDTMNHDVPAVSAGHAGHSMPSPGLSAAGSGTSRLPGGNAMHGLHVAAGDWMLMAHGYAWGVYSDQGGPRGDDMAFVASMAMLEASRPLGEGGRLQLRSMLSLDPLMGDRGYPNLFATGETAGGVALVDRQHPHDFFMELSARIDVDVAPDTSLFLYAGLPGEPALGPSAFMHRGSARLNPEAPITHHWFDSTHITFGVATLGLATRHWQIEASAFTGQEPDERRWNIEKPRFDSWAVRGTWSPSKRWQAQMSYGRLKQPEALHPGEDEGRFTASVAYAAKNVAVTAGYSHKNRMPGRSLDAGFVEANWDVTDRHTLFGRIERVTNDELFPEEDPLHGQRFTLTKATLGYAYTVPLAGAVTLALGGSGSLYGKPDTLDGTYGKNPKSFTLFAKLALGK